MRTKETARKSIGTGGFSLVQYRGHQEKLENFQKQIMNKQVKITPTNVVSCGSKDNLMMIEAVSLNQAIPLSHSETSVQSDLQNCPDHIALTISERRSSSSTPKRGRGSSDEFSSSTTLSNKKTKFMQTSRSQTRKYTERTKHKEEKSCKKLIDKHDKNILFKMLLEELDGEEILAAYKEKRSDWSDQQIKEEASKVLDVNLQANSADLSKLTTIQNILKELFKLVDVDLVEVILKTFGDQLSASKVLEYLEVDDVVAALYQKNTATQMLNLFQTANPFFTKKILESTSADAITDLVRSRKDLNTFEPLLTVLLQSISQTVPKEQTEDLKVPLTTAVCNLVKSKEYLKNSECLFNVLITNGPKILSNETKGIVKDTVLKKFSASELNDLSHQVISFHLAQAIVNIDD